MVQPKEISLREMRRGNSGKAAGGKRATRASAVCQEVWALTIRVDASAENMAKRIISPNANLSCISLPPLTLNLLFVRKLLLIALEPTFQIGCRFLQLIV